MNLTNIDHLTSTWKDVKTKSVIAVAAVAVVAGALTLGAPWTSSTAPAPTAPTSSVSRMPERTPIQVFYVVNSAAEGYELMGDLTPGTVVVFGTPQHEHLYGDQAWDMGQAGVDYLIVDLTRPMAPSAKMLAPASEADIMASVLSSERANYLDLSEVPAAITNVFDAERVAVTTALEQMLVREQAAFASRGLQIPSASETDIMASVVSTERAAWAQ